MTAIIRCDRCAADAKGVRGVMHTQQVRTDGSILKDEMRDLCGSCYDTMINEVTTPPVLDSPGP